MSRCFLNIAVTAEIMQSMGFTREQLEESLAMHRYDDVSATYHLLGLKPSTVCSVCINILCVVVINSGTFVCGNCV